MRNAELHSLRCDFRIKLDIAEKFKDSVIYFPYSLDFRGRAYPVPPNLNHLGSDLSRGLLLFDEAKPLGERGFKWLKVHLANLFGHNKISHDERCQWTESHIADVQDSADNPLTGKMWWTKAEEPFQALACCMEIVEAMKCDDPATYLCRFPVHQDGSCNGLQHYAALGRDEPGARAVNLIANSVPQDVYSKVLEIVLKKIQADCDIAETETDEELVNRRQLGHIVHGLINRRVIKQTVMTSVYGVTRTGARLQVQSKLEEKLVAKAGLPTGTPTPPELEADVFRSSRYELAHVLFLNTCSICFMRLRA